MQKQYLNKQKNIGEIKVKKKLLKMWLGPQSWTISSILYVVQCIFIVTLIIIDIGIIDHYLQRINILCQN